MPLLCSLFGMLALGTWALYGEEGGAHWRGARGRQLSTLLIATQITEETVEMVPAPATI